MLPFTLETRNLPDIIIARHVLAWHVLDLAGEARTAIGRRAGQIPFPRQDHGQSEPTLLITYM